FFYSSRRRHTRSKRDWSSDVCSSDLSWVSTTALFTARFRECAARSLLIPRWRPGTRQPLWRQRLKAEQLLTAVRGVPGFPVLLRSEERRVGKDFEHQ